MITDSKGNRFLEFRPMPESEINLLAPAFAVTLIKHKETFLFVFDRWRNHWEFPGGSIDPGETVRECAVRELREESGQTAQNLTFNGAIQIKTADETKLWGALYSGIVEQIQPFTANEEIAAIHFWDQTAAIDISPIDKALLAYFAVEKN